MHEWSARLQRARLSSRSQFRRSRLFTWGTLIAATACAFGVGYAGPLSTASAENPLYCNAYYHLDHGCPPPTVYVTPVLDEGRNEGGEPPDAGWVVIQVWQEGVGYSEERANCCNGAIKLVGEHRGFPKVWNGSEGYDLIHGRY